MAALIDAQTLIRDAKLVAELNRTAEKYRTEKNQESYKHAEGWFMKKHKCNWSDFIDKRGEELTR